MMMVMWRLIMMLRSRLIVVMRSMVRERSMEAIMDVPCGERHAPSLYVAHSLLIILRMIMIKLPGPQRAPADVSDS
jgi:isoprenylcysteine carboxyl methyltransferase (ICMT) family protein YpbQ